MKDIKNLDVAIELAYKQFCDEQHRNQILDKKATFALFAVLILAIVDGISSELILKCSQLSDHWSSLYKAGTVVVFIALLVAAFMLFLVLRPKRYLSGMGSEVLRAKVANSDQYELKSSILEAYLNGTEYNKRNNILKSRLLYYSFVMVFASIFFSLALILFAN